MSAGFTPPKAESEQRGRGHREPQPDPLTHTTHACSDTFVLQMPHIEIHLKSAEDPATLDQKDPWLLTAVVN